MFQCEFFISAMQGFLCCKSNAVLHVFYKICLQNIIRYVEDDEIGYFQNKLWLLAFFVRALNILANTIILHQQLRMPKRK